MYNVLLVDDDCLVRQTLKDIIDWEKFGFYIMGEAIDGIDAMNRISMSHPDIIILDMSMPQADGIEVIKFVKKSYSQIRILVLSCYDDFNYVKEALKLGANDYMLKHLLKEELLIETLHNIKQDIEMSKVENQTKYQMNQLAKEGSSFLKNKLLLNLLQNRYDTNKIEQDYKRYCKKLQVNNLGLIYLRVLNYREAIKQYDPNGEEIFSLALTNIITEVIYESNGCEVVVGGDGKYYIVINLDNLSQLSNKKSLEIIFSKLEHALQTYLKINTQIITSMTCASYLDLWQLYGQLENKEGYFFYETPNRKILFIEEITSISLEEIKIDDHQIKKYKELIKNDKFTLLRDLMIQECTNLIKKRIVPVNLIKYYIRLLQILFNYIYEHFDISRDYTYMNLTNERLTGITNSDELISIIIGITEYAEKLISNELVSIVENEYIKEAIKYIQCHYMEDLILADVAAHIHVTRTYFSHLFKQSTGMKFIDYVKNLRMKMACDYLLNTDMKIKEISEKVGIPNRKYFSKSFKQVIGVSPQEYKRQNI